MMMIFMLNSWLKTKKKHSMIFKANAICLDQLLQLTICYFVKSGICFSFSL